MSLKASFEQLQLNFRFTAKTSRGKMHKHCAHFLKVWDSKSPEITGIGEASPLPGLSPDHHNVKNELDILCRSIGDYQTPRSVEEVYQIVDQLVTLDLPAVRFALETALLDLNNGGIRSIFPPKSNANRVAIPINGLIWMGNSKFMKQQIDQKIAEGYDCIKMKIGALEFKLECELLEYVRSNFDSNLVLRVDANGAFKPEEATSKLRSLHQFNLHSIEQPISPGQWDLMRELSNTALVPVALDEELIGIPDRRRGVLLDSIKPHYLVLKPTLLGGLRETRRWIKLAEEKNIGWWITSALESNVGLNVLTQFASELSVVSHQGLGTGNLYENNTPGTMTIENGYIYNQV